MVFAARCICCISGAPSVDFGHKRLLRLLLCAAGLRVPTGALAASVRLPRAKLVRSGGAGMANSVGLPDVLGVHTELGGELRIDRSPARRARLREYAYLLMSIVH